MRRVELTSIFWGLIVINNWLLANKNITPLLKVVGLCLSFAVLVWWITRHLNFGTSQHFNVVAVGIILIIGWVTILPLGGLGITSYLINLIEVPQAVLRIIYLHRIVIVPILVACYCGVIFCYWRFLRRWMVQLIQPGQTINGAVTAKQNLIVIGQLLLETIIGLGLMYLCTSWFARVSDFWSGFLLLAIGTWLLAAWGAFLIAAYFKMPISSRANAVFHLVVIAIGLLIVGGWTQNLQAQKQAHLPEIISHRGVDNDNGVPNTVQSLKKTVQTHPAKVEMDVQETQDQSFVCFHDANLQLIHKKKTIAKLKNNHVKQIKLTDHGFETRMSTFDEYLKVANRHQQHLIVEIKPQSLNPTKVAQLFGNKYAQQLHRQHDQIHSVDDLIVAKLKHNFPDLSVGLIRPFVFSRLATKDVDFYSLDYRTVNSTNVRFLHAHHKKVYAWTVDNPKVAERMAQIGVDAIITDQPSLIRAKIKLNSTPTVVRVKNVLWQLI